MLKTFQNKHKIFITGIELSKPYLVLIFNKYYVYIITVKR